MSNEDGKPWVEFRPRVPFLQRPAWADEVAKQNGTYPQTGVEQVKDSVNRAPKPGPAAPVGVQSLEREIASSTARQTEIRTELVQLDTDYEAAALGWDVDQDLTARNTMNAIAGKRRALQHELNDLAEDMPRLRKRLEAAKTAQRHAEHVEDLAQLERALDEFEPVVELYRQAALDLVVLADELNTRRQEIRTLRRRSDEWAQHSGAARCERDVNREAGVPRFFDSWLQGGARNLADAKKALGLD